MDKLGGKMLSFLEKYSNIYVDLAQGSYIGRKKSKMLTQLDQNQTKEMTEKIMRLLSMPKTPMVMMQVRSIFNLTNSRQ